MEALHRDYAPKGVKFFYVYKALAHPELNGYVQPYTLQERLAHVKEAQRTLGTKIGWICDTMENDVKHALGDAPNSEFIIDAQGKVVKKRLWSDPDQLRKDLIALVGPVENPTRVSDLNLKTAPPPKVAKSGVLEKLQRDRSMQALVIKPIIKEKAPPFYAKLRAEATSELMRDGAGKLYLGFHLDPLYHVHWNNLVAPIKVTIETPKGIKIDPLTLTGPVVKEPSDIDPREFLIDVSASSKTEPIKIKVQYFACNDEAGWCRAMSQEYEVFLKTDPDAGWTMAGRGSGNRPGARPGQPRPGNRLGQPSRGRVVSVDVKANTITIRTQGDGEKTYSLDRQAQVMLNRRRATLSDFRRGDQVMFQADDGEKPTIRRMQGRTGR